jgi:Lrp/AsnC family leucine-responsive transcriptional regulator
MHTFAHGRDNQIIDDRDRRILAELQRSGRMTNVELAGRCHLSPAACLARVRRLEREGFITGYRAVLDATRLAGTLVAFVEIKLDRTTPDAFDRFARAVAGVAEVSECHMVAGGFDYLLKIRVADMTAYRALLTKLLVDLPGVRETHTYAVIEEVKNDPSVPLSTAPRSRNAERSRRRRR